MANDDCSGSGCGCGGGAAGATRREFLKTAAVALGLPLVAGPFSAEAFAQSTSPVTFIPLDKKLSARWVKGLYEKGETRVYRGEELKTIGMPVGGICAGQVYVTGDGRLGCFDVFNRTPDTGAHNNYETRPPAFPIGQGFRLSVERAGGGGGGGGGGGAVTKPLDSTGFPGVTFVGEYPLATVTYPAGEGFAVTTTMEAFSPFVPLNAADSGLPATVLRFRLANGSDDAVRAGLTGFLENAIGRYSGNAHRGRRVCAVAEAPGVTLLNLSVEPEGRPATGPARQPIVFADFEGKDYGDWKTEGNAFGAGPAQGTIGRQQPVSGFAGHGLVNTFAGSDDARGRAVSPEFVIERGFINFLIGGGAYVGKTCLNLVVDGKVERSATGRNGERLEWQTFNVRGLAGRTARLEIVDDTTGPWGHVNVDRIEFSDDPPINTPALMDEPDVGTMTLGVVHRQGDNGRVSGVAPDAVSLDEKATGELTARVEIPARGAVEVTFVLAWHFPNRGDRGQFYATRFANAAEVVRYLAANLDRLSRDTKLWHDTYYDSTLPHWLLDRLHMPVSTLATGTYQWWQNGRVWCWEGVGCCHGTCTHVYNYAQAAAHLFPEIERSSREMQDLSTGFHESGLVGFRGGSEYAADGQAGTVLKAYREHLFSADASFLKRNYPHVKRAVEFLIAHDASPVAGKDWRSLGNDPHPSGPADGVIEDPQHNTYDIWFHGPNTFVGALYLAALRAAEEMARLTGDASFATRCRGLFESGSRFCDEKLFDGEYYVQIVDLKDHPDHQYAKGCLADQLFGQNWARMLGLGNLFKAENVRAGLRSIYKYNWTPDVGPYNRAHPPQRYFARPGEAGLITCTFPKSDYLKTGVLYREEVWTGIEYQVASHMIREGMVDEGLTIVRGVHERYDPRKHNPWNEIECGDHYARAMASWGCLTALAGYHHDGPARSLSFEPRVTPEDFRCAFTTATAWGTYEQTKGATAVTVRHGELPLGELRLPRAGATVTVNDKPQPVTVARAAPLTTYTFSGLTLRPGDRLVVA